MNHNAVLSPNHLPTTPRPWLQRWADHLGAAWTGWRAQARLDNELRALEALNDATLRDIGMSERVLQRPAISALDYERARW